MKDSPIYKGIWETYDESWENDAFDQHSAEEGHLGYFADNGRGVDYHGILEYRISFEGKGDLG